MKQQTNNSQSTTTQALTSFPENPQLYIFAYTITDIMHILKVCKLVHFFRVVRSTGRVPNLNTNHCIYACYVHFYKKFSENLKKVLVKWLPVDFKQ